MVSPDGTNRLTRACVLALTDCLKDLAGGNVPLIVAGNSKFFSAGADLSEHAIQQEFAQLMRAQRLAVEPEEKPLVAVNGNAGNPHYSPTPETSKPIRSPL